MKATALGILLSIFLFPIVGLPQIRQAPTAPTAPTVPTASLVAADGSLDATFGTGGKVTTAIPGAFDGGRGLAIQADGKIVVAGSASNGTDADFAVVRYNANGSLDTSFDGDGMVITPIGNEDDIANAVAIQQDGKIVVAGLSRTGGIEDFAIVRYDADGSLDTSFDGSGKITIDILSSSDVANAVAIQPDGKIVAAGYSSNGVNNRFSLVRLNTDGSLDTSFDATGKATTGILNFDDRANAVVIQPDGKIVAAGYSENGNDADFAVVRYNVNGSLDTTFDIDGLLTTGILSGDDFGFSVAVQGDGKIVVAGQSESVAGIDFSVVRFNADGSLDTSFDADGRVTTRISSSNAFARSVAIQPDGKIIVAGFSGNGTATDFAVVSLNTDGSFDTSFDLDGKVTIDFSNSSDQANGVAIQSDGKIVVAGDVAVGTTNAIGVIRLGVTPTAARVSLSGRVRLSNGIGISGAIVSVSGGDLQQPVAARTNTFGYYTFSGLTAGQAYVVTASARRYTFAPRFAQLFDDMSGFDLIADR